jgi:hypothetical protein
MNARNILKVESINFLMKTQRSTSPIDGSATSLPLQMEYRRRLVVGSRKEGDGRFLSFR